MFDKIKNPTYAFYLVVTLFYFIELAVIGVLVLLMLLNIIGVENFNPGHVSFPVNYRVDSAGKLGAQIAEMTQANGFISIAEPKSGQVLAFSFLNIFIFSVLWLVTNSLRTILKSLSRGEAFTKQNGKSILIIAYSVIGGMISFDLITLLITNYLSDKVVFSGISLSTSLQFDGGSLFFAAVIILVVAHLFGRGLKLCEEQDLTI